MESQLFVERVQALQVLTGKMHKELCQNEGIWDIGRFIIRKRKAANRRVIHSGLMMFDNPFGYVCRVRRSESMQVPDDEKNFPDVLMLLAAVLTSRQLPRNR
ncbi:unnamed protein product [Rhizophagus irregularis]|nr:unnamed protein product [Rhizophagus irregularis]